MDLTNSFILNGLKTARLTFRKVKKDDVDAWMEFFNSQEALRFLPFKQHSRKACEEWIERQELRYKETNSGLCALIEKNSRELVGQCGLLQQEVDGQIEIEIGYHLLPRFWQQGYATEAAKAAKDFAFQNKLTDSVISIIHKENVNSQRVAEKNGMRIDKETNWRGFPVYIYRINYAQWKKDNLVQK
jgi:RimJ/RimL family protein N-acetyltransferase